jgi:monofunctional glycosyltransferase
MPRIPRIHLPPRAKKFLRIGLRVVQVYLLAVMVLGLLYWLVPPVSTLMVGQVLLFEKVTYKPVGLEKISPNLARAVIRAEDSRFCQHHGVDWASLMDTIEDAVEDGRTRGASTIPMQVTKNLFLWPQQSYIRKAIEIPIAMYLDLIWSKRHMMEVYLSIAEWGDGIFGAEAAAQAYFHKHAKDLNREEAALLAAALPNPKDRNPNRPGEYYRGYASSLVRWANADVDMSCLR